MKNIFEIIYLIGGLLLLKLDSIVKALKNYFSSLEEKSTMDIIDQKKIDDTDESIRMFNAAIQMSDCFAPKKDREVARIIYFSKQ